MQKDGQHVADGRRLERRVPERLPGERLDLDLDVGVANSGWRGSMSASLPCRTQRRITSILRSTKRFSGPMSNWPINGAPCSISMQNRREAAGSSRDRASLRMT